MIDSASIFVVGLCLCAQPPVPAGEGSISGIVVNSSSGESPIESAEVLLRIRSEGEFVPVAQTVTDSAGRFRFDELPLGPEFVYLPGANRAGIHYPGPRVVLTNDRSDATIVLRVQDTISDPSPLVIRDWEVVIDPEPGALRVSEKLVIENPQPKTYVGRTPDAGGDPVTLELHVPADFERITFAKEFYGRQFQVREGKLVTGLPWTPGPREVKFTYVLRNQRRHRTWERPLDLPCEHAILTMRASPDEATCNLQGTTSRQGDTVTIESNAGVLPADQVVRVELGRLPVPLMTYARWVALGAIMLAIAVSSVVMTSRRVRDKQTQHMPAPHVGPQPMQARRRRAGRSRTRARAI